MSDSIKNVQRVFLPTVVVRFRLWPPTRVALIEREQGACQDHARTLPGEVGDVSYCARAVVDPEMNTALPWSLDARVKYTRP
jgi:hypothetical protein